MTLFAVLLRNECCLLIVNVSYVERKDYITIFAQKIFIELCQTVHECMNRRSDITQIRNICIYLQDMHSNNVNNAPFPPHSALFTCEVL